MSKIFFAALLIFALPFCAYASATQATDKAFHAGTGTNNIFMLDKSGDENLNALIKNYASKFQIQTYSDDATGLSLTYNIFFPEDYSGLQKYPVVFFIADASSAGKEPEFSLTQGYGGLIWCEYDCVVIVPTFPGVVLDDHDGFKKSDYVELTARFVDWAVKNYSLDESRVYATGQSMGCMTSLVLAAEYPKLFTACLFVSGQWDINELANLTTQKFSYVASLGDPKASAGQREVINMFYNKKIPYVSYMNIDAKNPGVKISSEQRNNFVTFTAGTTLPDGTEGNFSEHMTSFDYAYKIAALREWLLAQRK